jgi:hypothetical protein
MCMRPSDPAPPCACADAQALATPAAGETQDHSETPVYLSVLMLVMAALAVAGTPEV